MIHTSHPARQRTHVVLAPSQPIQGTDPTALPTLLATPFRYSSLHTHKLSSEIVRAPCPAPTCDPTACPRSWGWAEMAIMMGASLSSPHEFNARSWLALMSSRLLLFWSRTLRRWPSFVPTGYNTRRELSCGCLALSDFHLIEFCSRLVRTPILFPRGVVVNVRSHSLPDVCCQVTPFIWYVVGAGAAKAISSSKNRSIRERKAHKSGSSSGRKDTAL